MIDGRDMIAEASRSRVKGETTFVDGLIVFAVDTANYLARRLVALRPDEASAARVLCELVKNQRPG